MAERLFGTDGMRGPVNSSPMTVDVARKEGAVKCGDTVVITAGVPIGRSGSTNLIKAQVVGE